MNATAARAAGARTTSDSPLWKRVLVAALVVLAILALLMASLVRYGVVAGEEFTADTFERRTYGYWEIPLIHVQVTPLHQATSRSDLEQHLVQNKFLTPRNQAKPRWDLARLRRAGVDVTLGDALILERYLDQKNENGDLIWLQWTKDNNALAKVLWPAVAEAARRELYVLAPALFHLAEEMTIGAAAPDEMKARLAADVAPRCEDLARAQQALGQHKRAANWFEAALHFDPASSTAAQGRDESRQAAGMQAEANPPAP